MSRARRRRQATSTADDHQPSPGGQATEGTSGLTKTRRVLAAALLLGWLVVLWISFQTHYLQACDDQIARVGRVALMRSCKPLSVTDAPALALLVSAGVLLIPDLSALEIAGVFRLERQLKEQAKRQDEIVAMIRTLEMSQRVEVHYNEVGSRAVKVGELAVLQDEKREQFDSDAP